MARPADRSTSDWVRIGVVVKPHGIRGEVILGQTSDVPGRFDAGNDVRVGDTRHTIEDARLHQGRVLVALSGVFDRSAAEALRGREVLGPPVDLADEDVFYAHELVGLRVLDADDRDHGAVTDLIEVGEAAGYDLLEVTRDHDGAVWLLPSADELVEVVEDDQGLALRLRDLPDGLVPGIGEAVVVEPGAGADAPNGS